jgi:hypothetical protein
MKRNSRRNVGTQGLAAAMQVIGNLPAHVIIQNPAGTYSFVGRVDLRLTYRMADGSPLTVEMARKIRDFGPGLFLRYLNKTQPDSACVESIVYPTEQAAREALAALQAADAAMVQA